MENTSHREVLTLALERAREAVKLDSENTDFSGAVSAYAETISMLQEVIDGVQAKREKSVDISISSTVSDVSVEEQVEASRTEDKMRLEAIRDTYKDRVEILKLIHRLGDEDLQKPETCKENVPSQGWLKSYL